MGMLGAAAVVVMAGVARGATSDGVVITNTACATFAGLSGLGWSVSYCVTRPVLVQNPCITLTKVANPTAQAAGGTVTFTLWVVNCSATASAFNVSVTDRLPDNAGFDAARGEWGGISAGTWARQHGSNGTTWVAGSPTAGQTTPWYLRFVLDQLGPNRSAFAAFSVTVL